MVTELQAASNLLQHGLLTSADVVQRGIIVQDVSRRNRNFALQVRDGPAYFLKQSDHRQSRKTVGREAACYRLLWLKAADFALRHMPPLRWFDSTEELLVLDYIDAVEPLSSVHSRDQASAMAFSAELGRALARLHDSTFDWPPELEVRPPWVLGVCRPGPELLAELSSTAILVVKIIQQIPDFESLLGSLAWPGAQSTATHGDIRWDNCLVRADADPDMAQLLIVDWELAGLGDPCWDVGGVICEYLSTWVRSLPVMPALSLEESLALSKYPLSSIQRGIDEFWNSYCERSRSTCDQAFLLRSIRSSAVRLIQSAIESAQSSARLSGTVVYTVQLAENILRDPRRAALSLLQVPLG